MKRRLSVCVLAVALAGTAESVRAGPLSLETFFQGHLTATGTLENYREKTRRDFTIQMNASWNGGRGTLIEEVAFADGERQHKVWTFDKLGAGRFVGHRDDLTREADVIEDDTGVEMTYKANTRVPSGSTYNLAFEDRLTPVGHDRITVTSDISYLFIPAARITMLITKASQK